MCEWRGRVLAGVLAGLCALATVGADACAELQARWRPGMPSDVPLLVNGMKTTAKVWGAGGGARAAAALLLAVTRHVLGHAAHLEIASLDICDLTTADHDLLKYVAVAPTALMPHTGCSPVKRHVDWLSNLAPAASPSSTYVFAHLSGQNCADFVDSTSIYTNITLESFGFIKSKDISTYNGGCDSCFAVLARDETQHDGVVVKTLRRWIRSLQLPLQLISFPSDVHLRKKVLELRNDKKNFIFLDEDIWSDVSSVVRLQPPNCIDRSNRVNECSSALVPSNAIRVGNGELMRLFAPPILTLVNNFAPDPKDLLQILELEISLKSNSTIVEAACNWAFKNDDKIKNWILRNYSGGPHPLKYTIQVFLCDEDPDYAEYTNITRMIGERLNSDIKEIKYKLILRNLPCSDIYNSQLAIKQFSETEYRDIAGIVAWGRSVTVEVAKSAENVHLPLLLAGPTLPEVHLNSTVAVHAVSATLVNLTKAYLKLFDRCGWTRVAVLTDDTNYSRIFKQILLSLKELLTRETIVAETNINDTLDKYRQQNARIFFVNTNSSISFTIVCTAWKLGMTPDAGFMWVVRDWRPKKKCYEESNWKNMFLYTIGSAWRGGATAGGSPQLRADLQRLWRVNDTVLATSANSAALAEALLMLGHGFAKFLREYPFYMYERRYKGSTLDFSTSLSKLILNGTAQELKSKPDKRLLFVEKWFVTRGSVIATWSVDQSGVRDIRPTESATCKQLLGYQPPDREYCATFTTGDPFAPRCHSWTIVAVVSILILASLALFFTRRLRLAAIKRLESESNQCVASGIARYIVSPESFTLLYKIGEGANGEVHFAYLKTSRETILVAAKLQKRCDATICHEFLQEGLIMAPLYHKHIIRLIGVCVEGVRPILFMEHAYYNDLQNYLTFRQKSVKNAKLGEISSEDVLEVSESELTRFAREAAAALDYLADQKLVHRDVRAANCLIDKDRSLKLADFGLARKFYEEESMYISKRHDLFPVLCMAPETFHGAFSPASDVWALGVLILEIATLGARPFEGWRKNQVFQYVLAGGHPPLPPDTSRYTRTLTSECWQFDAKSRPSAKYVHDYLTRNPQAISPALLKPDSPDPNLYSPNKNKNIYKRRTTCDLISLPF